MKKGDMYEAVVETIDFPNKGILHVDGERVIVKNAIPGQKVRFVVNKKRKGILDEVHLKEKQLSRIDYLRYEMDRGNKE